MMLIEADTVLQKHIGEQCVNLIKCWWYVKAWVKLVWQTNTPYRSFYQEPLEAKLWCWIVHESIKKYVLPDKDQMDYDHKLM